MIMPGKGNLRHGLKFNCWYLYSKVFKRFWVHCVPHQPPPLPDHPLLVKALTVRRYLLSDHDPDLAFLSLLYLRSPYSSLVLPHSVYRRPEPAPHCASPCLNSVPSLQLGLPSLAAASPLTLPLSQSSPPLSLSFSCHAYTYSGTQAATLCVL